MLGNPVEVMKCHSQTQFILAYSIIHSRKTNKLQRYTMVFITTNALHVSGGSSAHRQKLKTIYTAFGYLSSFFCFLLLS